MNAHRSLGTSVVGFGLALMLVACGGSDDGEQLSATTTTATPSTAPTSTTTPSTLAPTTVAPSTPPPTNPPPAPTTTLANATTTQPAPQPTTTVGSDCQPPTGTDPFNDGFPNRMSGMVGADIRTGAHECFERVVIELAGPGDRPGVRVEYVDDPVLLSPSDQTAEIDGDATLVISVAAWMPSMEGDGYSGPTQFVPDNVSHIQEVRQIENFEGMTAWAIGVDLERAFSVQFFESPMRIVVDIATAD